jgi:hypothetical protein
MAWSEQTVASMIVNPFYAITIADMLCVDHQPLVTKEQWVSANKNLIKEMGAEKWLRTLLDVLETGGPSVPR